MLLFPLIKTLRRFRNIGKRDIHHEFLDIFAAKKKKKTLNHMLLSLENPRGQNKRHMELVQNETGEGLKTSWDRGRNRVPMGSGKACLI